MVGGRAYTDCVRTPILHLLTLSSPYIMGKSVSTNARLTLQATNFSKSVVWKPFEETF